MELRYAAQMIRDTVSMQDVLDLYGYQPKHGFMVCPFHGDHDASLKVYRGTKGWHCFGCGRGGSVIDFVMEHDNCSFSVAVKAIDSALKLGLLTPDDPLDGGRRRLLDGVLDDLVGILMEEIGRVENGIEITLRSDSRKSFEIESKPRRERSAREMAELENLYEGMRYEEYRKEKCEELREEVKAWRREKRRQQSRRAR